MGPFDIHAWRQKQLIENYNNQLSDQILNQLFEELIPSNVLLNEGIGDFLSNLKDKIKNTKAFTSLLALSNEFKDASKAITLALKLKSLGLLPKNEAELQILKNKLEGKDINEATNSTYGKKLNSILKNPLEYIRMWQKSFMGKSATAIFAFFMIVNVVGNDIKDSAEAMGIDFGNTTTQAAITPSGTNMAGISNEFAERGYTQDQIEDVLTGRDDVIIKGKYSLGGDIKIVTDDGTGKSTVEIPDDIEDEGELSSETNNINQAAEQGLKLKISGDQTANFSLFDFGSSELTSEAKTELNTENDKIVDFLMNGQDYSETIIGQSSNTGPNSNDDNNGGKDKLDINRANALADYSFDDIKKELTDKGEKYTSSGTTITLENGAVYTQQVEVGQNTESLNQIDQTDDTPTQSAIRVGEVETTTPPTNVVLVDFDPVVAPGTTGGGGTFVPPPIETFEGLIREGQLSVIMALIKPEVKLFPYLNVIKHGKESDEVLGGYTQSVWVKLKNNESLPQESRTLAGAIINARKSPDTLTSRIAKCLGIELSKRALARQLRPGDAGIGQERGGFTPIKERIHPLYELLGEAVIDEFIDCNNVNKNAGQLLAYIGSMYASKDNTQIGIVNIDSLPSNIKSKLDKSGFKQTTVGRDKGIYVFMDKGTPDNISEPISLDPNIQVAKDKGAIPSSKLDIDSKPFKDGKIFISPKDVPVFPKDIYNTKFYKDAVKDGWVFVDRKDASSLPKGTKVKTFKLNLKNLKNIDYNRNKKLITLLEIQNKMKKQLLKERFQKLAGIKPLTEEPEDERFNRDTKTISGLADQFLEVSKRMRKGEYKGLQAGEINEIDDLIAMILQGAMEGNITPILQRLEAMAIKTVKGTGALPGQEDELDIEDETI
jgi:hypothetical protein